MPDPYSSAKPFNSKQISPQLIERSLLEDPDCPLVANHDIEPFLEAEGFDLGHPHHFEALDLMAGHLMTSPRAYELRCRKNLGAIQISPLMDLSHNVEPVDLKTSQPVWRKDNVRHAYCAAILLYADLMVAAHTCNKLERYPLISGARNRFRATMAAISLDAVMFNNNLMLAQTSSWLKELWGERYDAPEPKVTKHAVGVGVLA